MVELSIANKKFYVDDDKYNIEAMLLFGSFINGEYDEKSDIDFITIIEDCSREKSEKTREMLAKDMNIPKTWITIYRKSIFKEKCARGEFFVWKIRATAEVLFLKTDFLEKVYENMPINVDIEKLTFHNINTVKNVMSDYNKGKCPPDIIIALLAQKTRNECMSMCYLHGIIDIRKYEPVRKCIDFEDIYMPFTFKEYEKLYSLKRNIKNNSENFVFRGDKDTYINIWYRRYLQLAKEVIRINKVRANTSFRSPFENYL